MAAVAAARAAEKLCGMPIRIKWVNDLWKNGKKVCGILTEAALDLESGMLDYAVLGLGFNVGTGRRLAEDLQDVAGALFDGCPAAGCPGGAGGGVPERVLAAVPRRPRSGYLDEYRCRQALTGQPCWSRRAGAPRVPRRRWASTTNADWSCALTARAVPRCVEQRRGQCASFINKQRRGVIRMTKTSENVRRMVLCAMFTALVAVCSQIAVPMPWGVPINLALFAVYMAGTMLGPVWGTASQVVLLRWRPSVCRCWPTFRAAPLPSSARPAATPSATF